MYVINKEKIKLFKEYSKGYLYPMDKGVYLCFKKSGAYEGVHLMFLGSVEFYEHKADQYLQFMLRRGLLDFVD